MATPHNKWATYNHERPRTRQAIECEGIHLTNAESTNSLAEIWKWFSLCMHCVHLSVICVSTATITDNVWNGNLLNEKPLFKENRSHLIVFTFHLIGVRLHLPNCLHRLSFISPSRVSLPKQIWFSFNLWTVTQGLVLSFKSFFFSHTHYVIVYWSVDAVQMDGYIERTVQDGPLFIPVKAVHHHQHDKNVFQAAAFESIYITVLWLTWLTPCAHDWHDNNLPIWPNNVLNFVFLSNSKFLGPGDFTWPAILTVTSVPKSLPRSELCTMIKWQISNYFAYVSMLL